MVSGSNDSDARWIKASGISLRAGAAQRDPAAAPHTHRVQQGPSQPVGKAEELGSVCLYFSSPHLPDCSQLLCSYSKDPNPQQPTSKVMCTPPPPDSKGRSTPSGIFLVIGGSIKYVLVHETEG